MDQFTATAMGVSARADSPAQIADSTAPSIVPSLPNAFRPELTDTVDPRVLSPQPRSVTRRVAERLVLAVAALALIGAATWWAPDPEDTDSASGETTISPPSPGYDAADSGTPQPGWIVPEILFAPTIGPAPTRRADVPLPVPRPGR
jgi:hypothetical protein